MWCWRIDQEDEEDKEELSAPSSIRLCVRPSAGNLDAGSALVAAGNETDGDYALFPKCFGFFPSMKKKSRVSKIVLIHSRNTLHALLTYIIRKA